MSDHLSYNDCVLLCISCKLTIVVWNCHINKWSFVIQWFCVTIVCDVSWLSWNCLNLCLVYDNKIMSCKWMVICHRMVTCYFYLMKTDNVWCGTHLNLLDYCAKTIVTMLVLVLIKYDFLSYMQQTKLYFIHHWSKIINQKI